MTDKKILQGLKALISINGVAWVSSQLHYRDTRAIQKWIRDGKIPEVRIEAVKLLIEREK